MAPRINAPAPDHTREDYDFDYADGEKGPIRVAAVYVLGPGNSDIKVSDQMVWCIKHTAWEDEILTYTIPGVI